MSRFIESLSHGPIILCGANQDLMALAREIASRIADDKRRYLWIAGQPEPEMDDYFEAGIQEMVKLGDDMTEKIEKLWALVEAK